MAKKGIETENQVRDAFKAFESWDYTGNSNDPCCDRVGCIQARQTTTGLLLGLSVLIEAKEVHSPSFSFKEISTLERLHLNSHFYSGSGISGVFLRYVMSNKSRAWWVSWDDWLEIEDGFGFIADPDKGERRKQGSASVSLDDRFRPGTFVELGRYQRPNSLGSVWDLSPILPVGFEVVR